MSKLNLTYFNNKHFLALAGNGVISVLTVLQMALIYHKLEKSEVGAWVFFMMVLGIGEAIRNGFLSTATIKFYAGTELKRGNSVIGSVWYLALMITGVMVLVDIAFVLSLSYITSNELVITVKWFGLTFISSLPFTLIFWVLMAEERYDKILWLRMVNSGSMVLTILVFVILKKMTLEALLWINFLTNMLTNIVGYIFRLTRFRTLFQRTKESVAEIYHFGKFSLGTNLFSNLLRNVDIIVVNFMIGPAALAIYNIPQKLMEFVEIPLRSFVGTGMSGMAVAYNNDNKDRIKFILTKYSGMLCIAFIPMAIFAFFIADFAIYLIGDTKYLGTEAANLFRIFMIFSILYPIDRFNGATLDVIHKPKINFYKVVVMLVASIIGDLVGVYLFKNLYGIALGALMTTLTGLVFGYFKLRKYIDYTIGDIITIGLSEMKLFIRNKLSFLRK